MLVIDRLRKLRSELSYLSRFPRRPFGIQSRSFNTGLHMGFTYLQVVYSKAHITRTSQRASEQDNAGA
jgi:hypothetical protein